MITIFNNGDLRQFYIYKELTDRKIPVCYSNSVLEGVVILPITKFDLEGIPLDKVECFFIARDNEFIANTNKKYYKYINNDFLVKNAHLTSEGLISDIHKETNRSICGLNITILGYGRCGQSCALLYSKMGAKISVYTKNDKDKQSALISGFEVVDNIRSNDLIINTVPSLIITKGVLSMLSKETVIIDIASQPGGVDFVAAEKLNLCAINVLGIPGKKTPKSAALLMCDEILKKLKEFNI